MDLTDRLAAVAALYETHRNAAFPSRWRGADVACVEMVMLDSETSGCISVWLAQVGVLDDGRWNILAGHEQRLLRVIPVLDDGGREYYQQLLDMTTIDESVSAADRALQQLQQGNSSSRAAAGARRSVFMVWARVGWTLTKVGV